MRGYVVTLTGTPNHAGTTPMDARPDAPAAAAALLGPSLSAAHEQRPANGADTLAAVRDAVAAIRDEATAAHPYPGGRTWLRRLRLCAVHGRVCSSAAPVAR